MKSQLPKEIGVLDGLRGFAACAVMIFHFVCSTVGYFKSEVVLHIFDYGRFGVHLFFVISGFILPWSMRRGGYTHAKFFKFFLKRICRLEPPYIVSIISILLLVWVKSRYMGYPPSDIGGAQIAAHFLYLVRFFEGFTWLNNVYWTLAVEFQYYLFIAVFFPLFVSGKRGLRYMLYALCLGGLWMTSDSFLPGNFPFFLMGIVLFLFQEEIIKGKEFIITTILCIAVIAYKLELGSLIFAPFGVAIIYFWPQAKPALLSSLGKMSYSIYLFHPILGSTVINVLSHRYKEDYQKVLVVSAGVIVTLLGSWIMYRLVERPSKRLASSIKY